MASTKAPPDAAWFDLIILRHVQQEDLPLLEWDGEYAHFRRVFLQAFQRAQQGLSILWVAESQGNGIIGQAFVQLSCDRPELADGATRAYLYSVRVKPPFRRAGLGTRMLANAWQDLQQRGFTELTLTVGKDNPHARSMYERFGFQVVAEEPGIWFYEDEHGENRRVEEPGWRMLLHNH